MLFIPRIWYYIIKPIHTQKSLIKNNYHPVAMKGIHNFKVKVMHADDLPLLDSMTSAGTTMTTFGFSEDVNS